MAAIRIMFLVSSILCAEADEAAVAAVPPVAALVVPEALTQEKASVPPASVETMPTQAKALPAEDGLLAESTPLKDTPPAATDAPAKAAEAQAESAGFPQEAAATVATQESALTQEADLSESPEEIAPPSDDEKEHDEDGIIEVSHNSGTMQKAEPEDMTSLAMIPALAALMSFAGVSFLAVLRIKKILLPPTKGQASVSAAATKPADDLDFEDLEVALSLESSPTPVSRKRIAPSTSSDEAILAGVSSEVADAQAPLAVEENAWADDNGWGDANWDDLDDCEADLSCVESLEAEATPVVAAALPPKGKAD